jgi:enhancing lycopene biosynthesis protein 2
MTRKKIGVLLSGCGVYDGAEIHEAVITLLAIDRLGQQAICFAPDKPQLHVIDHRSGEVTGEQRNVLAEAARIARGEVQSIAAAQAADLDALVIPGGFGAAKNLCDFALQGARCTVDPEVQRLVREFVDAGKPVAALCIAPALIAAVFRDDRRSPAVTIGEDAATAAQIVEMGAVHENCAVDAIHVDEKLKIVTTPAYMLAGGIAEAAAGIEKAVAKVCELA